MLKSGMLLDIWKNIGNIITGFFAIIPQIIYFLYASIASLLDLFQFLIRKLVGLDVYYIQDPSSGELVEQSGDLLKEFIEGIVGINKNYSALNTVFWSLIIFGVMVLVLCTIFSVIKAHYNYDEQKSHPVKIVGEALKRLALMAIVPITVIFGLYLSEIILQTLDDITAQKPEGKISSVYEPEAMANIAYAEKNGDKYYAQYDIFLFTEWTSNTTFSGMLFEIMASSCNRVRLGEYSVNTGIANKNWDNRGIFYLNTDSSNLQEKVADQIDFAFINCLRLTEGTSIEVANHDEAEAVIATSLLYGPSLAFAAGLTYVKSFSKFNVGLVWYYYNLWGANFILGFAGISACFVLLVNIVFGLMKRLILCITLFLINAPIIGIGPLDGGNGFSEWKKMFISNIVAGFGTIVGMNLLFLIIPVLQGISLFNIKMLDQIFNMILVIAALGMVKKLNKLFSDFIGAVDLATEGASLKNEMKDVSVSALNKTLATAGLGASMMGYAFRSSSIALLDKNIANVGGKISAGISSGINYFSQKERDARFDKKHLRKSKDEYIQDAINAKALTLGKPVADLTDEERNEAITEGTTAYDTSVESVAKAKNRYARREKRKKISKATMDISGTALKVAGDLTGLKKAIDSLAKSSGDPAKQVAQSFFQAFGFEDLATQAKEGKSDMFSTSKQKEKKKKKQEEEKLKNATDLSINSGKMASQIFELTELIKRL